MIVRDKAFMGGHPVLVCGLGRDESEGTSVILWVGCTQEQLAVNEHVPEAIEYAEHELGYTDCAGFVPDEIDGLAKNVAAMQALEAAVV